jgi:hypothetical protein
MVTMTRKEKVLWHVWLCTCRLLFEVALLLVCGLFAGQAVMFLGQPSIHEPQHPLCSHSPPASTTMTVLPVVSCRHVLASRTTARHAASGCGCVASSRTGGTLERLEWHNGIAASQWGRLRHYRKHCDHTGGVTISCGLDCCFCGLIFVVVVVGKLSELTPTDVFTLATPKTSSLCYCSCYYNPG